MTEQFDEWEARIRLAGEEALRRLRLAADQGDTDAAFKLARCISHDYENGIKWLRLAAEQGHKHAQLRLGNVLAGRFKLYGDYTTNPTPPPDHAEAIKWYRIAAENGLARARRSITDLETPTPPDKLHKLLQAFRTEAHKGDQHAQFRHALIYCLMRPQDNVRAYLWLSLSAAQGNQRAKKTRDEIEQRMTPAQIAEAQKLAREWKPTKPPR